MSLVPDERTALRVGAIAIAVLAAAICASVFLLGGTGFGTPVRIRVVFRHAGSLREHAALVVAGRAIGRVEAIVPVPHGAPGLLGGEVGVAATVALDRGAAWQVASAAAIFVASRGPLSDKYLEVAPPAGPPGPAVRDGQELRGVDPPSLDNVLQNAFVHMTVFKLFIDTVKPEMQALVAEVQELQRRLDDLAGTAGEPVGALIHDARSLGAAARQTYHVQLRGDPGLAELGAAIDQGRAATAQLRATLDALAPRVDQVAAELARLRGHLDRAAARDRLRRAIEAARAALDQVEPQLAAIDELRERIAQGEGSVGRLMSDPEFSDDAKDLGKIMKRHPWRVLERPRD